MTSYRRTSGWNSLTAYGHKTNTLNTVLVAYTIASKKILKQNVELAFQEKNE